jgi:outer membrane protein OmpA-like peptidoglycan-associated protein
MKTTIAVILMSCLACATAKPSPELLSARDAYGKAGSGPATELNPADLHDAKVLLETAETSGKEGSPAALHDAYLAQRRAELADAQGNTSAARREKEASDKQLQALKDQSLTNTKGQLAQAQGQLAQAQVAQAQTQGQLTQAEASQAQTQTQLTQAQGQADSEHLARLSAEQSTIDALNKVAAVKQESRGMVITLSGSVLFASGRSELLPSSQSRLDQVAAALKQDNRSILIEGYTDSRGSDATNQALSQGRAQSVMNYLTPRGVQAERIHVAGMGAARPISENTTADGRANNRRVEIVLQPAL